MRGMRDRLAGLERRQLVGLLAVGVVVVGVAVVWYLRSVPSPVTITEAAAPVQAGPVVAVTVGPVTAPSSAPPQAQILVDVAGRVRHPGVYAFQQGDRLIDAIRRAGGALPGADLLSLNLAALLTDAEQIVVGRADGKGPPSSTTTGAAGSTSGSGGTSGGTPGKVNLNTASLEELDGLPGIGPVLAQRILDYREQHGPFGSIQDLLNVTGIGDAHMADLESLVTVS
jgi:competence protein ComEA